MKTVKSKNFGRSHKKATDEVTNINEKLIFKPIVYLQSFAKIQLLENYRSN